MAEATAAIAEGASGATDQASEYLERLCVAANCVPGLTLIRAFITVEQEAALLASIAPHTPLRADSAIQQLAELGIMRVVHEVKVGRSPDVASKRSHPFERSRIIFGPVIAILQLQSGATWEWRPVNPPNLEVVRIYVPRRTLLVLQNEARYTWERRVVSARVDIGNVKYRASPSIHLTFLTRVELSDASTFHLDAWEPLLQAVDELVSRYGDTGDATEVLLPRMYSDEVQRHLEVCARQLYPHASFTVDSCTSHGGCAGDA